MYEDEHRAGHAAHQVVIGILTRDCLCLSLSLSFIRVFPLFWLTEVTQRKSQGQWPGFWDLAGLHRELCGWRSWRWRCGMVVPCPRQPLGLTEVMVI